MDEWVRTPADHEAVAQGYYFDIQAAERVRTFFKKFLRHSKGEWAGQPFELLDWQWQDVIAPLFGWKRPDGTRRFRRGYIEVPKKNGKSTLLSGLSLSSWRATASRAPRSMARRWTATRRRSSTTSRRTWSRPLPSYRGA